MKQVVSGSDLKPWYGSKSHYQSTKWSHLILSKLNKLHCGFAIIPLWELCASLFTQLLCGWKQETFTSGKYVCNISQVNTLAPAYTSNEACLWCQQWYYLEIKQFLFCLKNEIPQNMSSHLQILPIKERKSLRRITSIKQVASGARNPEGIHTSLHSPPARNLPWQLWSLPSPRSCLDNNSVLIGSPEKLSAKDNCQAKSKQLSVYLPASFQVLWAINEVEGKITAD